jgi:hypothetical protein
MLCSKSPKLKPISVSLSFCLTLSLMTRCNCYKQRVCDQVWRYNFFSPYCLVLVCKSPADVISLVIQNSVFSFKLALYCVVKLVASNIFCSPDYKVALSYCSLQLRRLISFTSIYCIRGYVFVILALLSSAVTPKS